jgi:hypothetical protein
MIQAHRAALVLAILIAANSVQAEQRRPGLSTISAMARAGQIDEPTAGLYTLALLRDPSRLPSELDLSLEPGLPCATGLALRALAAVSRGPAELREEAGRLLAPPAAVGQFDSESYPIRVYYDRDADIATARQLLADSEAAWQVQVEGLGWTAPTAAEADGTPVGRLDIYLADIEYGGMCTPVGNNDLTTWTDALTYCIVSRAEDRETLGATVAHEISHALEFAEDAIEFFNSFEMFTVHTTHVLVPEDPYWLYFLQPFQASPHLAIHLPSMTEQLYHFGSGLFAQYLDERFGDGDATLAPRLWQAARQDGVVEVVEYYVVSRTPNEPDLFDVIDSLLAEEHGSSLREALSEFAVWRLLVGENDDGAHFRGGWAWRNAEPGMAQSWDGNELPVPETEIPTPPEPTGTAYVQVRTDQLEGAGQVRASFDLGLGTEWTVQAIRMLGEETPAEVVRAEIVDGRAELLVEIDGARAVVFAVTNLGDESFDADDWPVDATSFSYSLDLLVQPTVTSITPGAATAGVAGLEVAVEASPLDAAATLDLGPGITVQSSAVVDGVLTAVIDVAVDAEPGPRDVTVTNPTAEPGVLPGGFEVLPAPAPVLSSVEPGEVEPGAETVVVVHGSGLLPGAEATLGQGIEVTASEVPDATSMSLTLRVSADAQPGPRTLTVANPGGESSSLEGALTVLEAEEPIDDEDGGDGSAGADCSCRQAGSSPAGGNALVLLAAAALLGVLRRRG